MKIYHKSGKDFDDDIGMLLKSVIEHFEKEDRMTRERQIRHMRKLKLYWASFSQIYWSETAHDYRIYNRDINQTDTDQDYYDKPLNVFRAFLETLIAALSIQIPGVNCVPDDADNPLDNATAKAGDEIGKLIYKHNDVIFQWLHALYIYMTEGMIASYVYPVEDEEYGTYDKPKFKKVKEEAYLCPQCGTRIPDEAFSAREMDEFDPDDDDVELHDIIKNKGPVCFECGATLDPELKKSEVIIPRFIGITKQAKTRICLEVYGGLYIKVNNTAKNQKGTPYLFLMYETHYSNALECYPHLRDRMPQGGWSNIGVDDPYEQYGRLNTQFRGEFPEENVTMKYAWLRPASFNVLPEEDYKKLKEKFPDGAYVAMVNDICADYGNEKMDDHWTLTENPTSDYLTHDPLGELLTNIQDIVSDLISLTLQTIEHGIPQTWADPAVVNFNAQKQVEAMPGTLTPTKPVSGSKNISEAFFTAKYAQLAPEIFQFYKIIQELGQFVSGALPSIFGGQLPSGSSRTAAEYSTSKGMALQRLQTPWRMMTIWWKKTFGKAIPMFMKEMVTDERVVEKDEMGNYINVFIKKAEVEGGKIGSIELESSDKLPISDEEIADKVMQLFTINNQELTSALMDPENLPFISKIVRIPEFHLPGEDDREKQLEEIQELVNSVPIPGPDGQEQSSVQIDVDLDNHKIEGDMCHTWLIGPAGRLAKKNNQDGYRNVLLHMKAHNMQVQQAMQAQQIKDDQIALATGAETKKLGEPSDKVQLPKPKGKPGQKLGESNGQSTIQ